MFEHPGRQERVPQMAGVDEVGDEGCGLMMWRWHVGYLGRQRCAPQWVDDDEVGDGGSWLMRWRSVGACGGGAQSLWEW